MRVRMTVKLVPGADTGFWKGGGFRVTVIN